MKTVILLSDSHGRKSAMEKIRPLFGENDYLIHLGDGAFDMRSTAETFPEKTYVVRGNCDAGGGVDEFVLEIEQISVFCCHGHRYGVKSGLSKLAARAKELHCEVAFYGHTHRAEIAEADGIMCINPGSVGSYSSPSYAYLVVNRDKITPTVVPL